MSLHKRLAKNGLLGCSVAERFLLHPTVLEIAGALLAQQWHRRGLDSQHEPLGLFLISARVPPRTARIRPLKEVLLERFCKGSTLNLTPGEDHLSARPDKDPQWKVEVDLYAVEEVINDCGPWIIESYRDALVEFWSQTDRNGESPWQWYAQFLHEQFKFALIRSIDGGTSAGPAAALARLMQHYPWSGQQIIQNEGETITVHNLQADYSSAWQLDPNFASALLFERADAPSGESFHVVYTLIGRLLSFGSRQQLLAVLGARGTPRVPDLAPQVLLAESSAQMFELQAMGLLNQHLRLIESASSTYIGRDGATALSKALDRMTSMLGLCNVDERQRYEQLFTHLPDWLRTATASRQLQYAEMLTGVAEASFDTNGQNWLHGIASAETFALQKLLERVQRDHPHPALHLADVEVINYQVTAAALPGQGVVVTDDSIREVRFSLAQLAIANLGLLRPGRIKLESHSGLAVPAWFDEQYLRRLITEVDIGTAYPMELQHRLLDDPQQALSRQQQLMTHLRVQLPAQAMELHLRHQSISFKGVEAITQALASEPLEDPPYWGVRALGFKRSAEADTDFPSNAWLIEGPLPSSTPCLLYRPLHTEPLLEFEDRPALFAAISAPGALQDDLLQRLPALDRRVYAHGGFLEPHLFHPLDDTSSVPFGRPAPALITREPVVASLGPALYRSCVLETISHFREHSTSSAEARWQRWQDLGWLLLNTLLPFAEGPVAQAAWLVQIDLALAQVLDDRPSPIEQATTAWVTLLVNVAMLLLNHAIEHLGVDQAVEEPGLRPAQETVNPPSRPAAGLTRLDTHAFSSELHSSWSRPDLQLSTIQRSALTALQSAIAPDALGPPIPSGPYQGLYLFQDTLLAIVEGKVYTVVWDAQQAQPRITHQIGDEPSGPWLVRDEAGRWQVDLRLRLRGGMPLHSRLAQLKASNESVLEGLDTQLRQDTEYARTQQSYLEKVAQLASPQAPEPILRNYLEKTQSFSSFWEDHLERLRQRNERAPLRDYKGVRAMALYHSLRSLQSEYATLQKLYAPKRLQLLELYKRNQQGYELSSADEQVIRDRLDALGPLLDQLIHNSKRIGGHYEQLKRLASRAQPRITQMLQDTDKLWPKLPTPQIWRYQRMEAITNRLSMIHRLDTEASFWLDRAWLNLDLAISQRLHLAGYSQASDEAITRLLRSIGQQFSAARRQLDNLHDHLDSASARAELATLLGDLTFFTHEIEMELAEYPDMPPSVTVKQLRSQLPGLIETSEHGLLLGEPRADDPTLVDIPAPDRQGTRQTYHLEHDQWVQVRETLAPKPVPGRHKLSRLLHDSPRLITQARRELSSLQSRSPTNYLPIEIQEILQHHARLLDSQRNAIEQCLTADNQTDETSSSLDAATSIKALEDLSKTLGRQALELRTQAALAQKPRMGELQFLLARDQVQVRREGARTLLAQVKGRPADYLDEYVVLHQDRPLWYAHFHYRASDSDMQSFTAGHLKTAAQRYAQGARTTENGLTVEVYRAPITLAAAQAVFFTP